MLLILLHCTITLQFTIFCGVRRVCIVQKGKLACGFICTEWWWFSPGPFLGETMRLLRKQLTATICSTHGFLFLLPLFVAFAWDPKLFQPQVACPVCSYANDEVFHFCQNCSYKRRTVTTDVPPEKRPRRSFNESKIKARLDLLAQKKETRVMSNWSRPSSW